MSLMTEIKNLTTSLNLPTPFIHTQKNMVELCFLQAKYNLLKNMSAHDWT